MALADYLRMIPGVEQNIGNPTPEQQAMVKALRNPPNPAYNFGGWVTDKTGSPGMGVAANLLAGQLLSPPGVAMAPLAKPIEESEPLLKLFRGEYTGNKGGNYWTPDFEFAKQFTQSGLDKEVKTTQIAAKHIFTPPGELPYAGDPDLVDKAVAMAKKLGFKGVWLSEGAGQPNSVWMIKK